MVISRAKAAPEEAPTTVSTFSTTLPIIVVVADAPASMGEHRMFGERAGTAGKAQAPNPESQPRHVFSGLVGEDTEVRYGVGACAPYWSGAMPACSRPAILRLHAACRGVCEERRWSRTSASSAASRHTCDVDKPLEFVTADAPPTAASAVHFIGAAPLEDSSAR